MVKRVARTLVDVVESPRMKVILDRGVCVQSVIDEMIGYWSCDLYGRKPCRAYREDGVFVGTDLDLACFLFALVDRGVVINMPEYRSRRPRRVTEGEIVVSRENRHGRLLGVVANRDNFAFSVRVNDMNVIKSGGVGGCRNFMVVDVDGEMYDGWKTIDFVPGVRENDFITKSGLWTGDTVVFKYFVHPNRWISFYGQHYYTTKVLIERLVEEVRVLKEAASRLRKNGVIIGGVFSEKREWPRSEVVGAQRSIKIRTLEAEVECPEYVSEWPVGREIVLVPGYSGSSNSEMLKAFEDRVRLLTYTVIPRLRFAVRATEYAFFLYGEDGGKMPGWIENARWDRSYVERGKRKVWSRMVFARGVAIRYRVWEKSEIVAAE